MVTLLSLTTQVFHDSFSTKANKKQQGISFGAKLACDSVGSAGSIPKTTNDIGQLLYEFCDVNDVSFTFSDQCKGQTMVIGGTNNRCGNPCDVDGECVSGIQFGVLYIKGDPHHTVGTCYTSGPTGWTENCVSNGSHIYSELVYCHIDEAACQMVIRYLYSPSAEERGFENIAHSFQLQRYIGYDFKFAFYAHCDFSPSAP